MKEGIMPFVEVFTREKLSHDIRAKLAEELSNTINTIMTVEVGGPTESAKMIDWMWFHTMPANSWAVGGEVARVLKAALGVGKEEDDTGIFTMCVEIDDGQWGVGAKIPTLFQLLDNLGGNISEKRRAEMSARYPQKR
jgi:hypothetical protein